MAMVVPERLLQRMQPVARRETFHRRQARAIHLDRQQQTAAYGHAVEQHGAGAAYSVLGADVRAREIEAVAQEVGEARARLDRALVRLPVDVQADRSRHAAWSFARPTASTRARVMSVAATARRYSAVAWMSAAVSSARVALSDAARSMATVPASPTSPRSSTARRTGVGPAPNSAVRTRAMRPARKPTTAMAPMSAKSPGRRRISGTPQPSGAGGSVNGGAVAMPSGPRVVVSGP